MVRECMVLCEKYRFLTNMSPAASRRDGHDHEKVIVRLVVSLDCRGHLLASNKHVICEDREFYAEPRVCFILCRKEPGTYARRHNKT